MINLQKLQQDIVKKELENYYIFTGEEIAIMDIYINKIIEVSKTQRIPSESIKSIYNNLIQQKIIKKSNCYVVRNDSEFLKAETAWDNLEKTQTTGKDIVILIYNNIDKRSKFYNKYKSKIITFEKLSKSMLAEYIKRDIGLDKRDGEQLAEMCNCNYNQILLESDKIKQLAKIDRISIKTAFEILKTNKLIHTPPQDVTFNFIDAICKRQSKLSFELWEELKSLNQSPFGVLALLYINIKQMLLVKSTKGVDIAKKTGLTAWQIKMAKEKGDNYSIRELVNAMKIIQQTEKNIKIGKIDINIAMDYIIINILGG